ncbi:50S ribosomal protein acetyltransferase [hydrothermal vent metagenome]|uniref:50S ribosomal protein acetyltransferase n=1 Tax=hydrothermal vent metagenome TaxID=652676 RepID=A0A3B0RAV7_9ZZZZ
MFARTKRLLLRPGWPEDAPAVYDAINDESIVRMLARAPWPYTREDAAQWLGSEADPMYPSFLIFERDERGVQLIGSTGIGLDEEEKPEIGYWLRRSHWGRGFATEAGRAVMEIAKTLGHRHLSSVHFTDNPASGHVLRKLGFRPTGRIEPRHSNGRSGSAPCVVYRCDLNSETEEGDAQSDVMRPLAA